MGWTIPKTASYWIDVPDHVLPAGASGVSLLLDLVAFDDMYRVYSRHSTECSTARAVTREELEPANPQNEDKTRDVVARVDTVEVTPNEELANILTMVELVTTHTLDWRGIFDESGEPVPFSEEMLSIALASSRDLVQWIGGILTGRANDQKNQAAREVAKDVRFRDGGDRVVDGAGGDERPITNGVPLVHSSTTEPEGSAL